MLIGRSDIVLVKSLQDIPKRKGTKEEDKCDTSLEGIGKDSNLAKKKNYLVDLVLGESLI